MKWLEKNKIQVKPPQKPKKLTGTRFASVLGLNPWESEFKTWCAITRTYEEPFIENKYTIAGKVIEPLVVEYLRKAYLMDIYTPEDRYGKDFFKKTWGDFFPTETVYGGMWDGLMLDDKGDISAVIEIKTTKRAEDWSKGAPDYYALQASLYAYLLGVDDVIMVASFLEEKDYEHPEKFVPSSDNTIIDEFGISERYPRFQAHIQRTMEWWNKHIVTGISPAFDEKVDADVLKALRKNTLLAEENTDITALITEGESLKTEIDNVMKSIAEKDKRLKVVTDLIKQNLMAQFRDGDKKVTVIGKLYEWIVSRADTTEIDKDALKADGLLDKYTKTKISYRITTGGINNV